MLQQALSEVSVQEVAELVGVIRNAVYQIKKAGALPHTEYLPDWHPNKPKRKMGYAQAIEHLSGGKYKAEVLLYGKLS